MKNLIFFSLIISFTFFSCEEPIGYVELDDSSLEASKTELTEESGIDLDLSDFPFNVSEGVAANELNGLPVEEDDPSNGDDLDIADELPFMISEISQDSIAQQVLNP